jgi:hypothetical protein
MFLQAGERESGVACPHCQAQVARGDEVAQCRMCGTVHHRGCWDANGCGSYACAPARRPVEQQAAAPWRITEEDLRVTAPLPSQRTSVPRGRNYAPIKPFEEKPKVSRLAIAALIVAIAGIPLFGVVTGIVAIVLGSLALGDIHRRQRKGTGLALAGVLLGLVDAAAWVVVIIHFSSGHHDHRKLADFRLDSRQLAALPAPTARAMRANVLITTRSGMDMGIGSGIILRLVGGEAHILTNRHVVDPDFDSDGSQVNLSKLKPVEVTLIDQSRSQGRVVWLAPGTIDLAVVTAPVTSLEAKATAWPATRPSTVGDTVFAIGNPHALGWTLTQGAISQFRFGDDFGRQVSIIQTSTAINPGNSGGGLYDREGYLIGINTWTKDKSVSEGLNFSIALDAFLDVAPAEYKAAPPPTVVEEAKKP